MVYRIAPKMPAWAYRTYGLISTPDTFRKATCAEVNCSAYLNGFKVLADATSEDGRRRLAYLRGGAGGRKCREVLAGPVVEFHFAAGQTCFREHKARRDDRPPLLIRRPGDWRGNPTGEVFRHTSAASWVDDFGSHQQSLADTIKKG